MKTNVFYNDYSNGEVDGYALLKVNAHTVTEGYVIASVFERKNGKVRVENVFSATVYASKVLAIKALRDLARGNKEQQIPKYSVANKMTIEQATALLGISAIDTVEQIKAAFRSQVKASATGNGNYIGDMDLLVQAKEFALAQIG